METYSVFDVAEYFRTLVDEEEGDLLSHLKLQKLCYYAQGLASIERDNQLFSQNLEAWDLGPVVPDLYSVYKDYGGGCIPPINNFDYSRITPKDQEFLERVYNTYGQISARNLSEMTHKEAPWINAYRKGRNSVITVPALKEYFERDEVLKPSQQPVYDLNYLMEGVTLGSFGEDIDTGAPVGNEVW